MVHSFPSLIFDGKRAIMERKLITKLHKESKSISESSRHGINDKDARRLARACKLAIDLGKHGGKIRLPKHLRDRFPEFSCFFC